MSDNTEQKKKATKKGGSKKKTDSKEVEIQEVEIHEVQPPKVEVEVEEVESHEVETHEVDSDEIHTFSKDNQLSFEQMINIINTQIVSVKDLTIDGINMKESNSLYDLIDKLIQVYGKFQKSLKHHDFPKKIKSLEAKPPNPNAPGNILRDVFPEILSILKLETDTKFSTNSIQSLLHTLKIDTSDDGIEKFKKIIKFCHTKNTKKSGETTKFELKEPKDVNIMQHLRYQCFPDYYI
jgi:hypothetical protein